MQSNWVDFQAVKQAVPIAAVIKHYGIANLKKHAGSELRGRCPIHKGDSPESFHANTDKNAFQCFVCGKKGNVLDFVAAMEKCSVRDAALKLQDWFSIGGNGQHTAPPAAPVTGSQLAREKDEGRGEDTAENRPLTFQLRGLDHRHAYLQQRGIAEETARSFGAGFFPGKGSMSGRVVIPIHNEAGELVAYAGRSIDGNEPRYKLPAGFHKTAVLYNLHRAVATGQRGLIVVEGFFDAMKLHQAGYPFVVALMGSTLSEEQERLLVSVTDQVVLMFDGDEAGARCTDECLLRLGRKLWMRAVRMPDGKQPDLLTDDELRGLLNI